MNLERVQFRLNEQEQNMLAKLLRTWKRDGRATNPPEVFRLCLQQAFNKIRRSNRQPEIKFSVASDVRGGRPKRQPRRGISLPILNLKESLNLRRSP